MVQSVNLKFRFKKCFHASEGLKVLLNLRYTKGCLFHLKVAMCHLLIGGTRRASRRSPRPRFLPTALLGESRSAMHQLGSLLSHLLGLLLSGWVIYWHNTFPSVDAFRKKLIFTSLNFRLSLCFLPRVKLADWISRTHDIGHMTLSQCFFIFFLH